MIWIAAGILTLLVVVLLLRPLLGLEVAQAQTLPADLGEDEARTAAARRLLAEAEAAQKAKPLSVQARSILAVVVALLVPALGLGLYGLLGEHDPIERMAAPDPAMDQPQANDLPALAEKLGARLAEDGEQAPAEGWALYARTLHQLGRYDAAVDAYQQAARRDPSNGLYVSGAAEAMVFAANGTVEPQAVALFRQALEAAPGDPAARYYLALADMQAGRVDEAYQAFADLVAETDPAAPYFGALRDRLVEAAQAAGKPVPDMPEVIGPSAEDVAAAAEMSAEDRMAMIRGMVEGLAARLADEPDDLAGWQRLARARLVLQEWEAAAEANLQVLRLSAPKSDLRDGAISALKSLYPRLASGPLKDRVAAHIQ